MIRYSYENWTRYALGTMAFVMALLLTPRALLEIPEHADSHEIPVNLLENPEDCLWCTPPKSWEIYDCNSDEIDVDWLHPDISPSEFDPCGDEILLDDRSA